MMDKEIPHPKKEKNPEWIIDNIAEASRNARAIYLLFIGFLAYCAITVVNTKDVQLILNGTSHLPIINIDVPLNGFFLLSPLIAIIVFIYLQLYIHRLKGLITDLRTNYPSVEKRRLYPWMLNIAEDPEPGIIGRLQKIMFNFSLWWLLPIVLILFPLGFLRKHDPLLSYVVGLIPVFGTAVVIWFWCKYEQVKFKGFLHGNPGKSSLSIMVLLFGIFFNVFMIPWSSAGDKSGFSNFLLFVDLSYQKLVNEQKIEYETLYWVDLAGANLEGADFTESILKRANLKNSKLIKANFYNANLEGARLDSANLQGADLRYAHLESANLRGTILQGADLRGANLQGTDLGGARLQGADLKGAKLDSADLREAQLDSADLSNANLQGADLSNASLQGADLSNASLQGADLYGAKLQGAIIDKTTQIDDKWRLVWQIVNQGAEWKDLSGANLQGAYLRNAQLKGAILYRAELKGADLNKAYLQGADLSYAQLQSADLSKAQLDSAILRGADLSKAQLKGADLSYAQLMGAELKDANLSNVNLWDADLSTAKLHGTDLYGAKLQGAIIVKTTQIDDKWRLVWQIVNQGVERRNLSGADLRGANLQGTHLDGAQLDSADLRNANLQDADLMGAELRYAQLDNTNLMDAILKGADFSYAQLGARNLTIEQLSKVKTLYKAELDSILLKAIETDYPHLRLKLKERILPKRKRP